MAAGLGFKDFTTGEVLTAADVDGYLMQGVWVFASAAARDAAVTSPQEGNFAYLKDTNVTTYYTGSAWANLDTTGMTNPMTTTGDIIYSSSGSTPARLGIGSTGNVLTVSGGVPSWAAPSGGGGMTLLSTTTLSGTTTTVSSISGSYKHLLLIIDRITSATTGSYNNLDITANSLTTQSQTTTLQRNTGSHTLNNKLFGPLLITNMQSAAGNQSIAIMIYNYADTNRFKPYTLSGTFTGTSPDGDHVPFVGGGAIASTDAINAFTFTMVQSNTNGGTVQIYGVS